MVVQNVGDVGSVGKNAGSTISRDDSRNLAIARRIRAAGRPIYIPDDDGGPLEGPSNSLDAYQIGGLLESGAFEYSAGTGIMLQLVITVLASTFAIASFDLELPWEKMGFRWLDDPLEVDERLTHYSFSGKYYEFERKQVLNHRADVTRILRRGQSIRGYLLGNDMAPIPDDIRSGSLFPATVIIWDQYGRQYRIPVELTATRREKYVRRPSRRGALFDRRDPDPKPRVVHTQVTATKPTAPPPFTDEEMTEMWREVARKHREKTTVTS